MYPRTVYSRRPISPPNYCIEILETALCRPVLPVMAPILPPQNFVYRRGRGTGCPLIEVIDRIYRASLRRKRRHLASFDLSGSFDNVQHIRFTATLTRCGADGGTGLAIHGWLRGGTCQVRVRSAAGVVYSSIYRISRGLPHGGAPSSLLWLIFLGPIIGRSRALRGRGATCREYISGLHVCR